MKSATFRGKLWQSKGKRWKIMHDKNGWFLRLCLWGGQIELRRAPPDELGARKIATFFVEHGGRKFPEVGPCFGAETAKRDAHQFYVDGRVQHARNALVEFEACNG